MPLLSFIVLSLLQLFSEFSSSDMLVRAERLAIFGFHFISVRISVFLSFKKDQNGNTLSNLDNFSDTSLMLMNVDIN